MQRINTIRAATAGIILVVVAIAATLVYDRDQIKQVPVVNLLPWALFVGNTAANPSAGYSSPEQVQFAKEAVERRAEVLFFGDAIISRWPTVGKRAWNAQFAKLKAAGFGVEDDRTQHLLYRLRNEHFKGLAPRAVVLHIGTHNLGRNTAREIATATQWIVAEIRSIWPSVKIYVIGILPRTANGFQPEDRRAVTSMLQQTYANADSVRVLNCDELFTDSSGQLKTELFSDGLHLSEKGYQVLSADLERQFGKD
jgi:lysophospholipase L1-like esterase